MKKKKDLFKSNSSNDKPKKLLGIAVEKQLEKEEELEKKEAEEIQEEALETTEQDNVETAEQNNMETVDQNTAEIDEETEVNKETEVSTEEIKESGNEDQSPRIKVVINKSVEEKDKEEENYRFVFAETEMDLLEAMKRIPPHFDDRDWTAFEEEIKRDMAETIMPADASPAQLKEIINKASEMSAKLAPLRGQYQAKLATVEQYIDFVMKENIDGARNEDERKRKGYRACMNYKEDDGRNINLYEVYFDTKRKHDFLMYVDRHITRVEKLLVNYASNNKLENAILESSGE